jgi:hypothetical protein
MAVTVGWYGPGGGDGWADNAIPGRGGDGGGGGRDAVTSSWAQRERRRWSRTVTSMREEERGR